MNAQRRAKATTAKQLLNRALSIIESLIDAEQSALEGIPENMQTRVERCEDTISDLEDAKASSEDAIRQLEAATDR
jgi:predicted ribosome quality control (RQC) complex YloA/Tae2 family protein